jgi:hypothetical protein
VQAQDHMEAEADHDSLARRAEQAAAAVVADLQATMAAGRDNLLAAGQPSHQGPPAPAAQPSTTDRPAESNLSGGVRNNTVPKGCWSPSQSLAFSLGQHHSLTHPSHIIIHTLSHLVSLINDRILPPFDTATSLLARTDSLPSTPVTLAGPGSAGAGQQGAKQQQQQQQQQPGPQQQPHTSSGQVQRSVGQPEGVPGRSLGLSGALMPAGVVVRRTTSLLGYAVRSRGSAVGAGALLTAGGTRSRLAPSPHHLQHPRRRSWCPADQQGQPRGSVSVSIQGGSTTENGQYRVSTAALQQVPTHQHDNPHHTHHRHQQHLPRLVTQVSPGPLEWLRMLAASPDRSQGAAGVSLTRGFSLPHAFLTPEDLAGMMNAATPAVASGQGPASAVGGGTADVQLSGGGAVQPTGSTFDSGAAAGFLKMLEDG